MPALSNWPTVNKTLLFARGSIGWPFLLVKGYDVRCLPSLYPLFARLWRLFPEPLHFTIDHECPRAKTFGILSLTELVA